MKNVWNFGPPRLDKNRLHTCWMAIAASAENPRSSWQKSVEFILGGKQLDLKCCHFWVKWNIWWMEDRCSERCCFFFSTVWFQGFMVNLSSSCSHIVPLSMRLEVRKPAYHSCFEPSKSQVSPISLGCFTNLQNPKSSCVHIPCAPSSTSKTVRIFWCLLILFHVYILPQVTTILQSLVEDPLAKATKVKNT